MTTIEELLFANALLVAEVDDLRTKLTVTPATEVTPAKGRKAAPRKGRKAPKGKTPKVAPKGRFVTTRNIEAFRFDIGSGFAYSSLEELLMVLRTGLAVGDCNLRWNRSTERLVNIPEGWGFGPKALHYLAKGEWPS